MKKIIFDFIDNEITLNWSGQNGTESAPDLPECRAGIFRALGLPDMEIPSLMIDFEAGLTDPAFDIQDLAERETAVLQAAGYKDVDFTNVAGAVNALINGQIPQSLFNHILDLEAKTNEADPDVKAFLQMLRPDDEDE